MAVDEARNTRNEASWTPADCPRKTYRSSLPAHPERVKHIVDQDCFRLGLRCGHICVKMN